MLRAKPIRLPLPGILTEHATRLGREMSCAGSRHRADCAGPELGTRYVAGPGPPPLAHLPTCPFERERYWPERTVMPQRDPAPTPRASATRRP